MNIKSCTSYTILSHIVHDGIVNILDGFSQLQSLLTTIALFPPNSTPVFLKNPALYFKIDTPVADDPVKLTPSKLRFPIS